MKIGNIFCGLIIIIASVNNYFDGWDNLHKFPITKGASIFTGIVGLIILLLGFYKPSSEKSPPLERSFLYCEKCNEQYDREFVLVKICPKCNSKLKE